MPKHLRIVVALGLILVNVGAKSEVLFTPDGCKKTAGEWRYQCPKDSARELVLDSVTPSNSAFVKNLPFYNQFSYSFRCEIQGGMHVTLSAPGTVLTVMPDLNGEVSMLRVAVPYHGVAENSDQKSAVSYRFAIPSPFTRIKFNCQLNVSNQ